LRLQNPDSAADGRRKLNDNSGDFFEAICLSSVDEESPRTNMKLYLYYITYIIGENNFYSEVPKTKQNAKVDIEAFDNLPIYDGT
jgi:hypothetical protein